MTHERRDTSVMTGYSKGSRIRIASHLVRWHCFQTTRTAADILTDLDGTDYRLLRARTSKQEPLCDASRSVANSRDVTFPTFHQPFNIYFNTVSTTVISNTSLSLRTCVPHPSNPDSNPNRLVMTLWTYRGIRTTMANDNLKCELKLI